MGTLNFADIEGWKLTEHEGWKLADNIFVQGWNLADTLFAGLECCRHFFGKDGNLPTKLLNRYFHN